MTILFGCGWLPHAAGAEVDVLFLRDYAVSLHEHQGNFLEFGIDAVAMFEFDRVATHHMTVTADHFDKLARLRAGLAHVLSSDRDVSPTPRF
jgi:hypothetical protein